MKIALLNFPFDNNYGGNLQRYALMKVLENIGHTPTHLYTRAEWKVPSTVTVIKRFLHSIKHGQIPRNICPEKKIKNMCAKQNAIIEPFYNKYIRHTSQISQLSQFELYQDFDAYIVGSDQVWRKAMSWYFPYDTMFFGWLKKENVKRIAYAVSFGNNEKELSDEEAASLINLFSKFDAVSVREKSGIDLLNLYKWTTPKAIQLVDPTLLLDKNDYIHLIKNAKTKRSEGNMFCYVLDIDQNKEEYIKRISQEKRLKPFYIGINGTRNVSVEQWLRSFEDAELVVTDSYHGCIFSIIFNKPFRLMGNERRGMARFDSLLETLAISKELSVFEWDKINNAIHAEKTKAIEFLNNSLAL